MNGINIICTYHGMEFDVAGNCTKAPTQTAIPKTAQIPSYPGKEVGAFIWIWIGDVDTI